LEVLVNAVIFRDPTRELRAKFGEKGREFFRSDRGYASAALLLKL
jgi:hypothetical protein